MKKYFLFVLCLSLAGAQIVSADWSDDFGSYTNDTEIQAVYGTNGVFRSPYIHTNIVDTYSWSDSRTALGVDHNNGDYAIRALNRQSGFEGVSVTAWICPFTYSSTTGNTYAVDIRICSDADINNYQAVLQMTNGRFRVLDDNTLHYLDIDLDGDDDADADDALKYRTYYKIRIDAIPDTVNGGTYDVYINDILVYANARYRSTLATIDTTYLAFVRGGTSGGPGVAVDDVVIKSIMQGGWTEDFSTSANINDRIYCWSGNYAGHAKLPYVSPYGHGGTTNSSYFYGDKAVGIESSHGGTFALQPFGRMKRPATVEFWVNVGIYNGSAGGTGHVYICSSDIGTPGGVNNTNCWQARLDLVKGEKMKVYDGADDSMHEVGNSNLVATTYYKIKMVALANSAGGGMYNVYLNDSLVYENAKFQPAYANETPAYIKLSRDGTSSYKAPFAFDDFTITESPALGTLMLIK